jgi:hypothetical protein
MEEWVEPSAKRGLALGVGETHGLDSIDTCLRRLLSLRTRIETNWPTGGHFFGRGGRTTDLPAATQATVEDLLTALPTPLPLHAGGEPEPIICPGDTDMRTTAGRAVDAGLALLDGATLETVYPVEVKMLETRRYDSAGPILVSGATVGLLVATIIGTLEAISELIVPAPAPAKAGKIFNGATDPWATMVPNTAKAHRGRVPEAKRGPREPRI